MIGDRSPRSPFESPRGPLLPSEPVIEPLVSPGGVLRGEERPYVRDDGKPGWIELRVVDDEGLPAAGERYRIRLPDGSVAEGRLDAQGTVRVAGIDPGDCEVTLPDQNHDSWERVEEKEA